MTGNRSTHGSRPIANEEGLDHEAPDAEGPRPPYDARAEEALLGAGLLSRTALETLARETRPEDYYVPRHRLIAEALIDAFETGWETDPVTVSDWLDRRGALDTIGGPTVLVAVSGACPSTTSAPRYAAIVHDYATLRRLQAGAEGIHEIVRTSTDAHDAVLRAQALVGDVSAQNGNRGYSALDVAAVADLLEGDLEPEEATILTRADGAALLYPGKMHMIQAEPSSGKTWVALMAVLEILVMGGAAIYLDAEDSAKGILGRLLALGAEPGAVRDRFAYAQPHGAFGMAEKIVLEGLLRTLNPDLVVIDGVAEFLTRDGLSEDSASDVVGWMDRLPRWISRTGASVLMLDHVVKDREHQGRYARGSGAKLAVLDGAAYSVKVATSFDRKKAGRIRLVVAKDKPGGIGAIGDTAAMISIEPKADGERVVVKVEANSETKHVSDPFRPTSLMARVSKELEDSTAPLTSKAVRAMIHTDKPKFVSEAIARLVAEGYVRESRVGTATMLHLVNPYRGETTTPEPPPEDRLDLDLGDPEPPEIVDLDQWKKDNF